MAGCNKPGCEREATVGVRTTKTRARGMVTSIHWDAGTAPASADFQCTEHANELVGQLLKALA